MEDLPFTFLGVENKEDAKVCVIPIPYEATTCYGKGTIFGPQHIIASSRYMEDYEMEEGVVTTNVFTLPFKSFSTDPVKMVDEVKEIVKGVVDKGMFPIVLGGEHTITLGVVKALDYCAFDLVVFDAHMDAREVYDGLSLSHATVMKRCMELENIKQVWWIGTRAISEEEANLIDTLNLQNHVLPSFSSHFISNFEKMMEMMNHNIFISIDLDVLCPSIMPAVGTPEPGGIKWEDLIYCLRTLFSKKHVVGCDVVELCPIPSFKSADYLATRLVQKLIAFHLKCCKK